MHPDPTKDTRSGALNDRIANILRPYRHIAMKTNTIDIILDTLPIRLIVDRSIISIPLPNPENIMIKNAKVMGTLLDLKRNFAHYLLGNILPILYLNDIGEWPLLDSDLIDILAIDHQDPIHIIHKIMSVGHTWIVTTNTQIDEISVMIGPPYRMIFNLIPRRHATLELELRNLDRL